MFWQVIMQLQQMKFMYFMDIIFWCNPESTHISVERRVHLLTTSGPATAVLLRQVGWANRRCLA